MKIKFGIIDERGEVYTGCDSEDEARGLDYIVMTENFTWEQSDWTDEFGQNWINFERLTDLFAALCKKTGMKKAELAKRCGVTAAHFSRYCSGKQPVPPLVYREIERLAEKNA